MSREESKPVRSCLLETLRNLRERLPSPATARFDEMVRAACVELSGESSQTNQDPPPPVESPPADEALPASPISFDPVAGSEDDLLGELAALSTPGDISPSRVATMANQRTKAPEDGVPTEEQSPSDDDAEATKKLLTRLSTPLGALPAAERRKAETLVRAGKIRNESQLKQWIERNNQKRKLR